MKPPCEAMNIKVLPGLRALVALRLVEKHEFSQKAAAERLGTTQPAISQYKREVRGNNNSILKDDPSMMRMVDSIAEKASRGDSHDSLMAEFCGVCSHMRSSGMLCEVHRKMYPSLEKCTVCMDGETCGK